MRLTLLYGKKNLFFTIHPLYLQHGRHCSRSANFFFFKISSLYDEISFGSMLLIRMQNISQYFIIELKINAVDLNFIL